MLHCIVHTTCIYRQGLFFPHEVEPEKYFLANVVQGSKKKIDIPVLTL